MGDTVYRLHDFSLRTYDINRQFKKSVARLAPSRKELFNVWANSFPYRLVLPFDNLRYLKDLSLAGTGISSLMAVKMAKFNIDNFAVDICNREDVSIMLTNRPQSYIYRTYMKEHYGLNIFLQPDRRTGLSVFKVRCY